MKTIFPAGATALALLLTAVPAEATPGNGRDNNNGARSEAGFCPPGLRDRNPPCVPPGQARRADNDDDDRRDRRDRRQRGAAETILREAVRGTESSEDRDAAQALAIIGTLMGLALLEQNARERPEAAPVPPGPESEPSIFSFSEVPSRPASIEALAAPPEFFSDAVDPGLAVTIPEAPPFAAPEEPASLIPPPPPMARIEPLGDPLPGPVPTPQEEAILSDVFRRAADQGATGY